MRKLAVVLLAFLVVLLGIAPLPARADDESQTRVTGTVTTSTITGFTTTNVGRAKWEPVAGRECKIKNRTQRTEAEGTVQAGTQAAPSDHLSCLINQSNIAGIVAGNTVCVYINFSGGSSTTPAFGVNCPAQTLAARTFQARIDNTASAVTFSITEIDVESDD